MLPASVVCMSHAGVPASGSTPPLEDPLPEEDEDPPELAPHVLWQVLEMQQPTLPRHLPQGADTGQALKHATSPEAHAHSHVK